MGLAASIIGDYAKGKFTVFVWMLVLIDSVQAEPDNCTLTPREVVCNSVQDCTTLRNYRGPSVTSLTVVNSCPGGLLKADLYKFKHVSQLVLKETPAEEEIYAELGKILRLELEDTSSAALSEQTFAANKELVTLSISNNDVSYLPKDIFKYLIDLRKLYLRNNTINNLDPGAFQHNTGLRILDLGHNKIHTLRRGVFYFNDVVNAHLLLSFNNIKYIESGTFENCSLVTKLLVDHNEIATLDDGVLRGLTALRLLDVSGNKLQLLSLSAFAHMPQLRTLRADDNSIVTFGPELVEWARVGVVALFLQGNPLNCVCGQLSEAYEQSSALGPTLDLLCDDGQPWDVLHKLSCTYNHSAGYGNANDTRLPSSPATQNESTTTPSSSALTSPATISVPSPAKATATTAAGVATTPTTVTNIEDYSPNRKEHSRNVISKFSTTYSRVPAVLAPTPPVKEDSDFVYSESDFVSATIGISLFVSISITSVICAIIYVRKLNGRVNYRNVSQGDIV